LTTHPPDLSILRGGKFVKAPANASATANNVACIFDPFGVDDDAPGTCAGIPLSPEDRQFKEQRYWRLPIPAAAVFATSIGRLQHGPSECEDALLASNIHDIFSLRSCGSYHVSRDLPDGGDPSGDERRGGGNSGAFQIFRLPDRLGIE
jgi:hypothetical protein